MATWLPSVVLLHAASPEPSILLSPAPQASAALPRTAVGLGASPAAPGRAEHTAHRPRQGSELNQATPGLARDSAHFALHWMNPQKMLPKKRGTGETSTQQKNI